MRKNQFKQNRSEVNPGTTRFSIDVPTEYYNLIKERCINERVSLAKYIRKALGIQGICEANKLSLKIKQLELIQKQVESELNELRKAK